MLPVVDLFEELAAKKKKKCGRCNTGECGAETRAETRSGADKILCRHVGRARRGLAPAGGSVARGTAVSKRGILKPGSFDYPKRHHAAGGGNGARESCSKTGHTITR